MRFVGINTVVYRAEDMDLCHRFFDDWGLRTVKRTNDEVVLETREGRRLQKIVWSRTEGARL